MEQMERIKQWGGSLISLRYSPFIRPINFKVELLAPVIDDMSHITCFISLRRPTIVKAESLAPVSKKLCDLFHI